jgi:uncharacterized membrane protein
MDKHFLKSKTMWGAIIMGAHAIAMKFGYDIGDVQVWVDTAIQSVGLVMVVIGRIKAVKPVKIA